MPITPLLLVHGSLSNRTQWAPLRRALRRLGVATYAYDRQAPVPSGAQPPSLVPDAGELCRYMREQDSRVAVGASYGGAVVLAHALMHPDELDALVLIEPTLLGLLESPEDAQPLGDPIEEGALAQFYDAMAGKGTWAHADERARAALRAMAPALAEESRRLVAFRPSRDVLRTLAIPTLVLTGGRSPVYFRAIGDALECALPRVRRVHWPHGDHAMVIAEARALAELVAGFLAAAPA